MSRLRTLLVLPILSMLAPLAMPHPLLAQDSLVLVGVEAVTGTLVPVGMELVRRPGELRLDPQGRLTVIGGPAGRAASAALVGLEPATGTLVALDLRPIRRPGAFQLDPRTGALTAEGMVTPTPAAGMEGPMLVGSSSATGGLVPVAVELTREPGSYAIDPRAGIVSPSPRDPALLAFDPATQSLVLIRLALVRGPGGLSVDPATRRLSRTAPVSVAPASESLILLGTRSDADGLVAVDLDLVYRGGVLAVDPRTGALLPSQPAVEARSDDLANLGAHPLTGALGRVEMEAAPRPGEYAVGPTGNVSLVAAPQPPARGTAGVVFGAGLDVRHLLALDTVLEEVPGAAGFDAPTLAPGLHGFLEYAWRAISLGIEAAWSTMETEVTFPQGIQTGDLTYVEVGGNAKVTVPVGSSVWPYATLAVLRSWSKADFQIEGLSQERTHETTRAGIGAGLDYWLRPHWGLRFEALYSTTFEDSDASEHLRWRAAVMFSPRGRGTERYAD